MRAASEYLVGTPSVGKRQHTADTCPYFFLSMSASSLLWKLILSLNGKRLLVAGRSLLVPVTAECGARRGHRGRICGLSERRDGDQQDQRENSDEYPHDISS